MWFLAHLVSGALVREGVKDERRCFRLPLAIIGWFFFHWLLDSIDIYHNVFCVSTWNVFFWAFNFVGVLVFAWLAGRGLKGWRKIFSPHMLYGLGVWFIWDWEWILCEIGLGGPYLLHRYLLPITRGTDPWSAVLLECLVVFAIMLIAVPHLIRNNNYNRGRKDVKNDAKRD